MEAPGIHPGKVQSSRRISNLADPLYRRHDAIRSTHRGERAIHAQSVRRISIRSEMESTGSRGVWKRRRAVSLNELASPHLDTGLCRGVDRQAHDTRDQGRANLGCVKARQRPARVEPSFERHEAYYAPSGRRFELQ